MRHGHARGAALVQKSHPCGTTTDGRDERATLLRRNAQPTRVVVRVVVSFFKKKKVFSFKKQQLPGQLPAPIQLERAMFARFGALGHGQAG